MRTLLRSRTLSKDYSIGLGRAFPSAITRSDLVSREMGSDSPLEPFQSGDFKKYENLVREFETGQPVSVCEKGNWEDGYEKLHKGMMEGTIEPKLLTYNCDHLRKRCGGLADRTLCFLLENDVRVDLWNVIQSSGLLGTISVFLYAIISNRAFSVKWSQPIDFSLAFDSPHIDWSHPYTESLQTIHPIYGQQALIDDITDYNLINYDIGRLRSFIPNVQEWLPASKAWIRVRLHFQ
jgi:hypothetical protein